MLSPKAVKRACKVCETDATAKGKYCVKHQRAYDCIKKMSMKGCVRRKKRVAGKTKKKHKKQKAKPKRKASKQNVAVTDDEDDADASSSEDSMEVKTVEYEAFKRIFGTKKHPGEPETSGRVLVDFVERWPDIDDGSRNRRGEGLVLGTYRIVGMKFLIHTYNKFDCGFSLYYLLQLLIIV